MSEKSIPQPLPVLQEKAQPKRYTYAELKRLFVKALKQSNFVNARKYKNFMPMPVIVELVSRCDLLSGAHGRMKNKLTDIFDHWFEEIQLLLEAANHPYRFMDFTMQDVESLIIYPDEKIAVFLKKKHGHIEGAEYNPQFDIYDTYQEFDGGKLYISLPSQGDQQICIRKLNELTVLHQPLLSASLRNRVFTGLKQLADLMKAHPQTEVAETVPAEELPALCQAILTDLDEILLSTDRYIYARNLI